MKSLFTLLFVASLSITLIAQTNNGVPLPVRATTEVANDGFSGLSKQSQSTFFYNPDSTLQHEVEKSWDTATLSWVNNLQYFYSNYPDGRLAEKLTKAYQTNGTWIDVTRTLYTYYPDPNYLEGEAKTQERQNWNSMTNAWEISSLITNNVYGPGTGALEGTPSNQVYEAYYFGEKVFGSIVAYDRVQTSNGARLSAQTFAIWNSGTGMHDFNTRKDFIYNDPEGLEYDTIYEKTWDFLNAQWSTDPYGRSTQTISGNVRTEYTEGNYGSGWINQSRITTTTDNAGRILTYDVEQWSDIAGDYKEVNKSEILYNPDFSTATILNYNHDDFLPAPGLYVQQKISFEYGLTLVGARIPELLEGVHVFPNPADSFVQIKLDDANPAETRATLLDARGNVAAQVAVSGNSANISLLGKAAGIYFLRVEQGGAVKMIPVVKL